MPADAVARVEIVPLSLFSVLRAEDLAARLSRRMGAPCGLLTPPSETRARLLPGRDQADADALLASLERLPAPPDAVLVGVTPEDIAIPIFTFVFGLARMGGRAALISLARLDPGFYGLPRNDELILARAVNEILHELGHVAQLQHCDSGACLMRFAGSVEKVDVRGSAFCGACIARLPRWLRGAEHADHHQEP
jgi:archaemetzincin